VALAKFGQYDKAVKELERLVKEGPIPLQAAINLLRCHLSLASPEVALNQYKRWESREELGKGDLKYLQKFLDDHFKKKGIDIQLIEAGELSSGGKAVEEKSDDLIDLSSIGIQFPEGKFKGKMWEFDVSFQSGNTVSIIIPLVKKDMAEIFKKGLRLPNIQCTSPIAIFNGSGVVVQNSNITTGPKRGSFNVDIRIDGK